MFLSEIFLNLYRCICLFHLCSYVRYYSFLKENLFGIYDLENTQKLGPLISGT